ncbi:hypothetical protein COOONC_00497, partial [Cooperia oncophora]
MEVAALYSQEWKQIVNRVVAAWGGYQLGWFKEVIAEYTLTARALKADDLEDWLNNVLYTEFNLILDDGSVFPTSALLIEALGYLKRSDRLRLDQVLSTLPSVEAVHE